jgi:GTPase Era involved in 16S rRNA processing
VAVLGQFKAGKSSFLNSLIGREILPVGVIPVTTTVTRIQYGEKENVIVRHFDGKETKVTIPEVEDFTSEAKNPANCKNVEVVDIELPSLKDYEGLRLVDTPGLGSVYRYHMETSKNWLPEAGAALLAISADRPLGEDDLDLIRELKQNTPRIVLLLTKADLLSPEQQSEVVAFFRATVRKELHQEFPIFLYSTQQRTEEWKEKVEKEIFQKIARNREQEIRHILQHKTHSLAKGCLNYLEIALQASLQADQDRERLRKMILDEKVNYDLIQQELNLISRGNSKETRWLIMNRLEARQLAPLKKKMVAKLAAELPSWKGNLWKLTRRYEEWLRETLLEELVMVSQAEHKHFFGTLKKAHAGLLRSLTMFRNNLNQNVEKVLGVKLTETDWKMEILEPDQPDIKTSRTFDYHFDLLWFLIPMGIFRPLIEKHYFNQVSLQVEINLSRLASQWEERINKAIEEMRKQALQYVKDELATLEALLSKARGRTDVIRGMIRAVSINLNKVDI